MKLIPVTIFLFLFTLIAKTGNCQKLKHGYIRMKKVDSFRQIFELKKGCLLVMLHTKQNKIEALRAIGQSTEADTLQRQMNQKNITIMQSFHDQFDYCPVYFFLNSEAIQFLENGSGGITFINDSLFPDSSIHIKPSNYLVAEFGVLQWDPDNYFSGQNIKALTLQNNKLIQLKKPFPYYIGIAETESKIVNVEVVVAKLNERLKKFEEKAKKKIINKRFAPYFNYVTTRQQ